MVQLKNMLIEKKYGRKEGKNLASQPTADQALYKEPQRKGEKKLGCKKFSLIPKSFWKVQYRS